MPEKAKHWHTYGRGETMAAVSLWRLFSPAVLRSLCRRSPACAALPPHTAHSGRCAQAGRRALFSGQTAEGGAGPVDLGLPLVFYYLHCPPSLRLERGARALEAGDSGRAALYRREGLALGVGGGKEGGFACMRTRQTTQSTHREHTHTHTHTQRTRVPRPAHHCGLIQARSLISPSAAVYTVLTTVSRPHLSLARTLGCFSPSFRPPATYLYRCRSC